MGVRVKGADKIKAKLAKMSDKYDDPKLTKKVGILAVQMVAERTQDGKDMHDRKFKSYTSAYSNKRTKTGRGTKVDLTDKGNMLAAMTYRSKKGSVVIFFRGADENLKAHGHHNGISKHGVPARPFFGLTKGEESRIMKLIKDS